MATKQHAGLAELFALLLRQATQSGQDKSMALKGGARLAVRVHNGVATLSIARPKQPIGDRELITFRRDCQIPAEALRWPDTGQHQRTVDGVTWHQVVFRWSTPEEQL